jgi:hypothetical protein
LEFFLAYNVPDASVTQAGLYLIPDDPGERQVLARRIVAGALPER